MTDVDIECLTSLVVFLTRNKQIISSLYGNDDEEDELAEFQTYVEDPFHWKMMVSRKITKDDCFPYKDAVGIYLDGKPLNRYGEATGTIPLKTVKWVRYFVTLDDENDFGMLVYELNDSTIVVGTHCDTFD